MRRRLWIVGIVCALGAGVWLYQLRPFGDDRPWINPDALAAELTELGPSARMTRLQRVCQDDPDRALPYSESLAQVLLTTILESKHPYSTDAAHYLEQMGSDALDPLAEALAVELTSERRIRLLRVVDAWRSTDPQAPLPDLIQHLESEDEGERKLALKIACTGMPFDLKTAWLILDMFEAMPDWSQHSPPVALVAMGPAGKEMLLHHLREIDDKRWHRHALGLAAKEPGWALESRLPVFAAVIGDPECSFDIRAYALHALARRNGDCVECLPAIRMALRDGQFDFAPWCLPVLHVMGEHARPAVEDLIPHLQNLNPEVRDGAASVLAHIGQGDPRIPPALQAALLLTPSAEIARALATFGRQALPLALDVFETGTKFACKAARITLTWDPSLLPECLPRLRELFEQADGPCQEYLAYLLALAGNESPVEGLAAYDAGAVAYQHRSYESALASFVRGAAHGHPGAAFHLGDAYRRGRGRRRDLTEAKRWFTIAAERGHAGAMYHLGSIYKSWTRYQSAGAEAARWFRKASAAGSKRAPRDLAWLYIEGHGVPQDYGTAVDWLLAARTMGDRLACVTLGNIRFGFTGHTRPGFREANDIGWREPTPGIKPDHKAALQAFQQAIKLGYPSARFQVGVMYREGDGCEKDLDLARRHFELGADRSCADCMLALGLLHFQGEGTPRDTSEALYWFKLSYRRRSQPRAGSLLWAAHMRLGQIDDAQTLATQIWGAPREVRTRRRPRALGWKRALRQWMGGTLDNEQFIREAWDPDNSVNSNRQTCLARFYMGMRAWSEGDEVAARMHFKSAIGTTMTGLSEYRCAQAFLAELTDR